ncbi:MAG: hypothetical protein WC837_14135 [Bellilinea sp.]
MVVLPPQLYKELKPVTIYLGDLIWIEESLAALNPNVDLKFIDSNNAVRYIIGVSNLTSDDSIIGLNKVENLEFNNYDYFVWFHNGKTIIKFTKITQLSNYFFEVICSRLERKQRRSNNQKQKIYLFHEHTKGNFLSMDINTVKGALIAGGTLAVLDLLIRLVFKIFGGD